MNTSNLRITLYILSFLFLASCKQEQDVIDAVHPDDSFPRLEIRELGGATFKHIPFGELGQNSELLDKLNATSLAGLINSSNSKSAKSSFAQFNFRIDSSSVVKRIEKEDYISYTFNIQRQSERKGLIENLLIEFESGINRAFILSYKSNEDWLLNNINGIRLPFQGTVSVESLFLNNNSSEGSSPSMNGNCSTITIVVETSCSCDPHHMPGESCSCGYMGRGSYPSIEYIQIPYCDDGPGNPVEYPIGSGSFSGGGGSTPPEEDPLPDGSLTSITGDDVATESTQHLRNILDLSFEDEVFLNNNTDVADRLLVFLYQMDYNTNARSFTNDLIEAMSADLVIENDAVDFALEAFKQGKYQNNLDSNFLYSVDRYTDLDLSDIENHNPLITHYAVKIVALKHLNPEWSNAKVFWEATKEAIHISLDVFGTIPVVGEIADLTNGALYLIEGDGVNATLSLVSAVPFVGWVGTATKYGIKVVDAYGTTSKVKLVWKIASDGSIQFARNSKNFRKTLGLGTGDPRIAHHLIPFAKQSHPAIQKAARSQHAFNINEFANGIPVTSGVHSGSHANYSNNIQSLLDDIDLNQSLDDIYDDVIEVIDIARNAIINNPSVKLNDLIF